MTKADIIRNVHERMGISKSDSARFVESVFDIIKETLAGGEDVKISGFGKLNIREKTARRGRNPQTGEEIKISARRVLTFKSSQVLKKALND
ncbi:MAG: integration host factor subunit alpha [Deltaproteobacteria bacterium]|nr:integration host factor subunit alpha [Deltaproteobacteria bacterium]MBW2594653.1 integration host factor subunit alpha [Deltaproteobacteria bacterium]MBW2649497.1 integration host factor subunit alpha [Deltaproteobacteria bacterium]